MVLARSASFTGALVVIVVVSYIDSPLSAGPAVRDFLFRSFGILSAPETLLGIFVTSTWNSPPLPFGRYVMPG